jgi:hypothetical protein
LQTGVLVVKTGKEVIEPNSLRMIAGEGFPLWKRQFEKGRLFVLFRVKFPTPEQLKQVSTFCLFAHVTWLGVVLIFSFVCIGTTKPYLGCFLGGHLR